MLRSTEVHPLFFGLYTKTAGPNLAKKANRATNHPDIVSAQSSPLCYDPLKFIISFSSYWFSSLFLLVFLVFVFYVLFLVFVLFCFICSSFVNLVFCVL